MTALPSLMVRTSLMFLIAGFALGGWMLTAPGFALPVPPGLRNVHIHFLTVGFMTLMVMGVALWMFPAPPAEGRQGISARERFGWAAYGLLISGLLLRAAVELVPLARFTAWGPWMYAVSALLQVAAPLAFAVAIWARTRPRTFIREPAPKPRTVAVTQGVELNLDEFPPAQWTSAVLQAWAPLPSGQYLVLAARRLPRAQLRMLEREQPGHPRAEYLVQGPDAWRVRIQKP